MLVLLSIRVAKTRGVPLAIGDGGNNPSWSASACTAISPNTCRWRCSCSVRRVASAGRASWFTCCASCCSPRASCTRSASRRSGRHSHARRSRLTTVRDAGRASRCCWRCCVTARSDDCIDLAKTPSFRLDGKRALVTGGGRGIGLAAASALAAAGAHVTLAARTKTEIEEAAAAIRARGEQGRCAGAGCDRRRGREEGAGGASRPIKS